MRTEKARLAMPRLTCSAGDCDADARSFGACLFHSALRDALNLTPEDYRRLQNTLAEREPHTEAEKQERQIAHRLFRLKRVRIEAQEAEAEALDAGATQAQIEAAR